MTYSYFHRKENDERICYRQMYICSLLNKTVHKVTDKLEKEVIIAGRGGIAARLQFLRDLQPKV